MGERSDDADVGGAGGQGNDGEWVGLPHDAECRGAKERWGQSSVSPHGRLEELARLGVRQLHPFTGDDHPKGLTCRTLMTRPGPDRVHRHVPAIRRRKNFYVWHAFSVLLSIHHVEIWCGNAKQAAYYYRQALGFDQIAYAGLDTGSREFTSYALRQKKATLVLSTPLGTEGPMTEHIRSHGDAVHDIAFHVDDADAAYAEAIARGARGLIEPRDISDDSAFVCV